MQIKIYVVQHKKYFLKLLTFYFQKYILYRKFRNNMNDEFIEFIGKNVPSKKNSKIITRNKRIISSKLTRGYEQWISNLMQSNFKEWEKMTCNKTYPFKVGFYFYRDSRRKWDFVNIIQTIADVMQDYQYIIDDDTKHFIPIYLGEELTKKEKSGFKMKLL